MKMSDKYTSSSYIKQSGLISKVSLVDKKGGKSKYVAINPQLLNLIVYSVDGGIINSVDTHKCDFAIYTSADTLYLIELKGSDYEKALKQIRDTIEYLLKTIDQPNKVFSRVVLSKARTVNFNTTEEMKLMKQIKKLGGNHKKQTVLLEENLV